MMFQNPQYLSMIGMGAKSVPGLERGIHLRWQFLPERGFPTLGFKLYRRQHSISKYICLKPSPGYSVSKAKSPLRSELNITSDSIPHVSFNITSDDKLRIANDPRGIISLNASLGGTISIKSETYFKEFKIMESHKQDSVIYKAYDNENLVAMKVQNTTRKKVSTIIAADRFNKIEILFKENIYIYQFCWVNLLFEYIPTEKELMAGTTGWNLLNSCKLPRSWDEASDRIPEEIQTRLKISYPKLQEIINQVEKEYIFEWEEKPDDAAEDWIPHKYTLYPVKILLMASLDTAIARMLGLYFIDETALLGVHYDYLIIGTWSEDNGITKTNFAWICYDLTLNNPPGLDPPEGLTVISRKLFSKKGNNTQTGCSLRWTVPDFKEIIPSSGTPVMYHIYRQYNSEILKLTERKPVIIGHSNIDKPFFIDGPLEDGEYSYKISSMDLFGQESSLSEKVSIDLIDLVPPPPPIKVRAVIDNITKDTKVSWIWDEGRKKMAPDAKEFRIYYQTENLVPLESYISKVQSISGYSILETELETDTDYSKYTGGFVLQGGKKFKVYGIAKIGSKISIAVKNNTLTSVEHDGDKLLNNDAEVIPVAYDVSLSTIRSYLKYEKNVYKAKGRFLLQMNWSDRTNWIDKGISIDISLGKTEIDDEGNEYLLFNDILESIPIITSASIPVAYALIGVSTEDESGNEGAISVPAKVAAYWTTKPEAPKLPTVVEYASRADYYGKSYYTLKLSVETDYYYEIMRASDAAIAFIENNSSANADLISDDELISFATKSDNERAFVKVGRIEQGASGEFKDSFPGKARNRYLYRTIAGDKAGNRSAFSDGVVLVKLHDVTPPKAPVITKIEGGDRQITIQWAKNREKDLAGYRVFKTDKEELSDDIRSMELIAEPGKDETTYVDTVEGLKDYWYRITAFDEDGNQSMANNNKSKAYDLSSPATPEWLSCARSEDRLSAKLELTSSQEVSYLIQRQKQSSTQIINITGWLADCLLDPLTNLWSIVFEDNNLATDEEYYYKIKIKSTNGLKTESEGQITK